MKKVCKKPYYQILSLKQVGYFENGLVFLDRFCCNLYYILFYTLCHQYLIQFSAKTKMLKLNEIFGLLLFFY